MKRHCLADRVKKEDPTVCCLQETHHIIRNKHWYKMNDCKKIQQTNGALKQEEVAIHISDNVDFKLTLAK
jgi:hypothetical protein